MKNTMTNFNQTINAYGNLIGNLLEFHELGKEQFIALISNTVKRNPKLEQVCRENQRV